MRVLHLTLKSKWYDLIESGIKAEEYRDINPYWVKRLLSGEWQCAYRKIPASYPTEFTHIRFARGGHFHKSIPQILIKCEGIKIGTGTPEWGAEPGKEYFVIKLGEIIKP